MGLFAVFSLTSGNTARRREPSLSGASGDPRTERSVEGPCRKLPRGSACPQLRAAPRARLTAEPRRQARPLTSPGREDASTAVASGESDSGTVRGAFSRGRADPGEGCAGRGHTGHGAGRRAGRRRTGMVRTSRPASVAPAPRGGLPVPPTHPPVFSGAKTNRETELPGNRCPFDTHFPLKKKPKAFQSHGRSCGHFDHFDHPHPSFFTVTRNVTSVFESPTQTSRSAL